jgi:hypothetical protein
MMGNRGELKPSHYELPQPFVPRKPWITCVFKDRHGVPYPKIENLKYTKLFFLDEVTAFAAGHRPCGQCQKKRYMQFVEFWCKANLKDASLLDDHLQSERCSDDGDRQLHPYRVGDLPSGAMVKLKSDGQPHLLLWGRLFPWTVTGYQQPVDVAEDAEVLAVTPPSIIKMFLAGFPLLLNSDYTVHPSVVAPI